MSKRSKFIIILLLVLTAAVIVWALFGMDQGVETPPVELPTAEPTDGSSGPGGGEEDVVALTPDTVQAVISMLTRADSYSRTVTVEDFWDGGSSSTELKVWEDHGRSIIRVERDGYVRNILISGGKLYIWYDYSADVFTSDKVDGTEADEWLRCISYDELLDLPSASILNASYELFGGESCIYVEYVSGEFGYKSCVYISVSTGLLMGARVYDGETLVYQMNSSTPDLATPGEEVFALPGASPSPEPEA